MGPRPWMAPRPATGTAKAPSPAGRRRRLLRGWSTGVANASFDQSAINLHQAGAANGYVRVTGGLGQGRVDNWTFWNNGYGWAEAHTYDKCGAINPPPYFPTTGRFIPSRYYEIDPVWLNSIGIANYFARLQSQ